MNKKQFLGERSYPAIVSSIVEQFQSNACNTLVGENLVNTTYQRLCESTTPMMELKEFITGAEKVAADDTTVGEIVKFCKNKMGNADLNFLINLCKEEHIVNLRRSGHPDPESTLKNLEDEFDKPNSLVEQAIKNGIFDNLQSKLLNDVKTGLGIKVKTQEENIKELNESYQYDTGGFAAYCPVGLTTEVNGKMVILTESDALNYDKDLNEFNKIEDFNYEQVDEDTRHLMECVNSLNYNPETETFKLNNNWKFNFELRSDGKAYIGKLNESEMKFIGSDDLRKLFSEYAQVYKVSQADLKEADQMLMLYENYDNLVKFDNLKVLRNLNENKYVMIDMVDVKGTNTPKILSLNGTSSAEYKNFRSLCESVNSEIGYNCSKLFESEMSADESREYGRFEQINQLQAEQQKLNEAIDKVRSVKQLADVDSPAYEKLCQQENQLNNELDRNIEMLKQLTC